MQNKYLNKYRIESNRLKGYDYSSYGYYFITIVTQNRIPVFGDCKNGKVVLNEYGMIALEEWLKSGNIRKELDIDEFVIMPNHIHGIVILKNIKNNDNTISYNQKNSFFRKPKSISSFIAGYKSGVMKRINQILEKRNEPIYNRYNRLWQPNYFDRIIRNEKEYIKIVEYIRNNPSKYTNDIESIIEII
jgi:REP element-mobilizing transposase RayT